VEVRKQHVRFLVALVPCMAGSSSPEFTSCRCPPRQAARRRRWVSTEPNSVVEFTTSYSSSRSNPRAESCPEARDRVSPAIPPPLAAVRHRLCRRRNAAANRSRPIGRQRFRSVLAWGQTGVYRSTPVSHAFFV
jgi:hypothetical protein